MSEDLMRIRHEELMTNPSNRLPIALCLDTSSSMSGDPIKELNEGIRLFIDAVKQDPIASSSVEMCVVTFSDQATAIRDFQTLNNVEQAEVLATGGSTNLGAGVTLALDLLEKRKAEYKRVGIDYFQPWLILMTDGQPTTNEHIAAGARTCSLEQAGKLVVFPIAIGTAAELPTLAMFTKKREPLRLKGLNFRDFFQWLSKSVSRVSHSRPGEKTSLDVEGIKGWAEI